MKRGVHIGSRMSGYGYTEKKKAWKWTGAKIASFSLFGVVMVVLIYLETASTTGTGSSTQNNRIEQPDFPQQEPQQAVETSEFDKEYQDFLKRGKKMVAQNILDSINRLQSENNAVATKPPPEPVKTPVSETVTLPSPSDNTTSVTAGSSQTLNQEVEKTIELFNVRPADRSSSASNRGQRSLGKLEEISPPTENELISKTAETVSEEDKSITEEFYTEEIISGTIAAASDGTPLNGVSVTVKGTSTTVLSDENGQYSITVPGDPLYRTIQYSFRGNVTERDVSPGNNVVNVRF